MKKILPSLSNGGVLKEIAKHVIKHLKFLYFVEENIFLSAKGSSSLITSSSSTTGSSPVIFLSKAASESFRVML